MTKEEKKVYMHTWYLNHKQEVITRVTTTKNIDNIRKNNAKLAKRNREYINRLKCSPCLDCKNTFPPCAMEFDHRDRSTKTSEVANLASSHWSIKRIQAEVDKCDLVCSNCHRIRTFSKKHFLPLERLTREPKRVEIQSDLTK